MLYQKNKQIFDLQNDNQILSHGKPMKNKILKLQKTTSNTSLIENKYLNLFSLPSTPILPAQHSPVIRLPFSIGFTPVPANDNAVFSSAAVSEVSSPYFSNNNYELLMQNTVPYMTSIPSVVFDIENELGDILIALPEMDGLRTNNINGGMFNDGFDEEDEDDDGILMVEDNFTPLMSSDTSLDKEIGGNVGSVDGNVNNSEMDDHFLNELKEQRRKLDCKLELCKIDEHIFDHSTVSMPMADDSLLDKSWTRNKRQKRRDEARHRLATIDNKSACVICTIKLF